MTTLTEWADLPAEERDRRTAEARADYVLRTLDAMHTAAHITHTATSRPYIAHGRWYVNDGSASVPFSDYMDAANYANTYTSRGNT